MPAQEVIIEQAVSIVEIEPQNYEVSISAVGERGPASTIAGPQGPPGPAGPPGSAGSGASQVFIQNSPLSQWTITHTLGYYPAVTIVDSGGTRVHGDLQYLDVTTIRATFSSAFSGVAYLS